MSSRISSWGEKGPRRHAPPCAKTRCGQLALSDALLLVAEAESLLSGSEYRVESGRVLSLVAVSPCSAYDCEFVALALELGVSLVTSDRQVLEAFPSIAVALDSFSSS
jgi:predicted nucleic acid-binding protein